MITRPVEPRDWPVVERLFGERGACGGCWCMWWRLGASGDAWNAVKGDENRARFREELEAGRVHAVMAFEGDEAVGWCSFGPRDTFPRIRKVRALKREAPPATWSIVCFYVPAAHRRTGIARALLAAATDRAFELGAGEIEGFPARPKKNPDRVPAAFASTGVPPLFRAAGYEEVERPPAYYRLWVRRISRDGSR